MRRLKRLANLPSAQRELLLKTLYVVAVARIGLWVLPVEAAQRRTHSAARHAAPTSMGDVKWAVQATSRFVPRATCLTQALAVQALLSRSGQASQVEIGVKKDAGKFEAHAWVVCEGRVIIGGLDLDRYSRLTTLDTINPSTAESLI